jgi:uncharacterized protein
MQNLQSGPESPCVRNCCLDQHDICVGCKRTLEEILQWGSANDKTKRSILEKCAERRISVTFSAK